MASILPHPGAHRVALARLDETESLMDTDGMGSLIDGLPVSTGSSLVACEPIRILIGGRRTLEVG